MDWSNRSRLSTACHPSEDIGHSTDLPLLIFISSILSMTWHYYYIYITCRVSFCLPHWPFRRATCKQKVNLAQMLWVKGEESLLEEGTPRSPRSFCVGRQGCFYLALVITVPSIQIPSSSKYLFSLSLKKTLGRKQLLDPSSFKPT